MYSINPNIQNQPVIPEYVEWSNGEVDYNSPFQIVVCPMDTTTYTATAYLAGCSGNTASVTVNVNTDPLISAQPTPGRVDTSCFSEIPGVRAILSNENHFVLVA